MTLAWWLFSVLMALSVLGTLMSAAVWAVTSRIIARQDAMEAYFKKELERLNR